MNKLTLAERIELVEAASEAAAEERLARADAAYHPSPEWLANVREQAERVREDYEFRQDVKVACWIAGVLVVSLCTWWIYHLLSGGLL